MDTAQKIQPSPAYIWWEAEKPAATNFPKKSSFSPANPQEADVLSGGDWISADGDRTETLFLEYTVDVPATDTYHFYARKFWKHGPYRWRFDDGPWHTVGRDVALLDNASLRLHVGANWTPAGTVKLTEGKHTLRIELLEKTGAAAFDAFLLSRQPFTARGKLKPGEKYNRAPAGWFPFEPDPDPFAPSPIDLRSLNEPVAGQNGYIRVKGESFVHGKTGKPVRFWAVNAGSDLVRLDNASVDHLARFLAKKGVNLIRYHGTVYEGSGPNFGQVDRAFLDQLFYFVAAMKKQGIYTALSIYFPLWVRPSEANGFLGYNGERPPFDLLYFDPKFQALYRNWWRALLTTKNPYTGVPLNADPAVAIAEMVNEESHFFWTFTPYQNLPEPQTIQFEKRFGEWLAKRHGSVENALEKWGGNRIKGDVPGEGRAGFMPLYEIFNKKDLRAQETATFLMEDMRRFYGETYDYLTKDLKFKGSVYGSNWITANAQVLGPLDKYANNVADFFDRHGYYGGPHEGERAGYSLSAGDRYRDRSALRFESGAKEGGQGPDFSLPLNDIVYHRKPSTLSEVNWTPPNRYLADFPLLTAAYSALQGSDAPYFFALAGPGWQETESKFSIQTPVIMGQFPATAYLYRMGLVKEAPAVVEVDLNLGDLKALKGTPVSGPLNLDELRAADIPAGRTAEMKGLNKIDPRAFYVGKVAMNFTEGPGGLRVADLSQYINEDQKRIRSATGQLLWNYDTGLMTVNAPGAQGATGFLKAAGPVKTADATISSPREYGAITLVSMDGKPISTSGKILLQVMSEEKNYGWETAEVDGWKTIRDLGAAPLVIRAFEGTVSLNRRDAAKLKVTPLDFNGYRQKPLGSAKAIRLQPRTLYYLIEK
ncbi:MAG: hypothetical protein KY468_13120 [Armatimonadetes bacterium]|nr:hypothetical protein [Armatimonadota bacterium]